jgi:diketogulonate reductase-like aldo/keto reductase
VSNFDVDELAKAVEIAGPGRIACNQVLYHLEERAIEHAVLPACRESGIAVVAYSPFGSGDFPKEASRGGKVLGEMAAAHGATPHQVALAFLLRDPGVFVIPRTSSIDHARANAAAGDLDLSADELARIDEVFPRGRSRALPTL